MSKPKILKEIEEVILSRSPARVEKVFSKIDAGEVAPEAILGAMTAGMEKARRKLKEGECSIPEFLLCIDAFRQGVGHLKDANADVPRKEETVVIGVVEGDVHDMGKNIVAGVSGGLGVSGGRSGQGCAEGEVPGIPREDEGVAPGPLYDDVDSAREHAGCGPLGTAGFILR